MLVNHVKNYPFQAKNGKIFMMKELTKIKVFRIDNPLECSIIERLNRFVVMVEIKGTNHPAYINNTGRLSEFLVKGRKAFCFRTQNQGKTDFRLFAIDNPKDAFVHLFNPDLEINLS